MNSIFIIQDYLIIDETKENFPWNGYLLMANQLTLK